MSSWGHQRHHRFATQEGILFGRADNADPTPPYFFITPMYLGPRVPGTMQQVLWLSRDLNRGFAFKLLWG